MTSEGMDGEGFGPVDVLVIGDSVPAGERTTATRWPDRLPDLVAGPSVGNVTVRAGMGETLASIGERAAAGTLAADADIVLLHAGHNDAQTSDERPRVPIDEFRAAARAVDRTLDTAADRHAFVGLVPLLALDRPGSVPFGDDQPERSLRYDDVLGETVGTHVPVDRPVDDWPTRTEDGVHPNDAGHGYVAGRVATWIETGP
ncbi:hypothetical protein BRD17_01805 [Halobacteriales archaeon SW_7_68_16]|nr:MAG: hypothetical protein BRD17_01805 [Halobacteriales archaeon SW_7_68_16]